MCVSLCVYISMYIYVCKYTYLYIHIQYTVYKYIHTVFGSLKGLNLEHCCFMMKAPVWGSTTLMKQRLQGEARTSCEEPE